MEIVNKLYYFFHTPLNNKRLAIALGVILSYSIINLFMCCIDEKISMYMLVLITVISFVLVVIIRISDYLYHQNH